MTWFIHSTFSLPSYNPYFIEIVTYLQQTKSKLFSISYYKSDFVKYVKIVRFVKICYVPTPWCLCLQLIILHTSDLYFLLLAWLWSSSFGSWLSSLWGEYPICVSETRLCIRKWVWNNCSLRVRTTYLVQVTKQNIYSHAWDKIKIL